MDKLILKLYEAFDGGALSPEGAAVRKQADPYLSQIQAKLSLDEFDHLWTAAMEASCADAQVSFARGFRSGARLMLDLLSQEL